MFMKKKLLMLFLGSLLFAFQALAQQVTVTGKITSTGDGQPIPGASVKIKGTNTAVQTAPSGLYSIKANTGDVLQFSYLGMLTQERTVGASTTINIALAEDAKALNEVVVTAQGIERSKRSLAYDAPTVKGADLAQTQRENFINALQGRVAGVTITPTNGTPGASSSIIIRGAVSLDGDNQPLFVVDGLPISNNTFSEYGLVGQGTFNRTNDYGNRGMDINPEEIESVTILKGPEAAALYGTQGASGAVVITTKKAKSGTARVSYSGAFTTSTPYRFPEVQTVYGGGAGGIFDEEVRTRTYFGAKYPEGLKRYDNLDAFYGTGFAQRHSASIEGGNEALSLRLGVLYNNNKGPIQGTDNESINIKLTGSSKIGSKLTIGSYLNMISQKTNKTYKGSGSPMISVLSWPSLIDIRDRYTATGDRRLVGTSLGGELDNPLWAMENNPNWDKVNRVITNVNFRYTATDWLSFQGAVGADIYSMQILGAYHPQSYNANVASSAYSGGGINTSAQNSRLFNGNLFAIAKKDFGKFKPVIRLGLDASDNSVQTNSQFGTRFYQPNFYSLNNTDPTTQRVAYQDVLIRKMGAIAQAELGYDDMLYLTLTGRQDFTSTLPIDNYTFFYPSAALSFVFSELPVFKKMAWLSEGKLRGGWAQTGKDARTAYITKTKLIAQGTTGGGFGVDVTLGNPNLKAEFTTSIDLGIDLGFFNNRLSANFSYYKLTSDGQITAPRLSYATGAILAYINSGKIVNQGFELSLKGSPIRKPDFTWDVGVNMTRTKGKLTALPGDQETFYVSDSWLFDNVRRQYFVGSSISGLSSQEYMRNKNGEILISPGNGLPIKDSNWTQIGDTNPDFGIGLTNNFTYKNFNLSFLFDIRKGGDIYNATELYLYARGLSKTSLDREEPRIIKGVLRDGLENTANPTQNNIVVIPYITTSYYSTSFNTIDFIEKDINWIRLKDVTLGYNLPKSVFANSKTFKSASVFFTGTDLWLLTNYTGVDPSVNGLSAASGGTGGSGIDFGSFGQPRSFSLGVRVGF